MGNQYCAISTKLQGMYAGYLTDEDYMQLLEKKSVGEICVFLKNTVYAPFLEDVNEYDIHRSSLEQHLDRKYEDEYSRLYTFANLEQKKLLQFFFMEEETAFLKKILRDYYNHESLLKSPDNPENGILRHSRIDFSAIRQGGDLSSLVNACRETPYYKSLQYAASGNVDYAGICMLLDQVFFKMLWRYQKKYLPEEEKGLFAEYIGSQIDSLNLSWIYRCKKYFSLQHELIYTYLIPVFYRLRKEDISRMVEAKSLEECIQEMKKTRYRSLFADTQFFIEHNFKRQRYELAKKMFRLHPRTMTEIYAMLELKQIELQNLDTIIEGVRYHISPEIIREQICIG